MAYHQFTTSHLRVIKENLHLTDRELAEIIGVSKAQIQSFRRRNKLTKPSTFSKHGANYGRGKKAA